LARLVTAIGGLVLPPHQTYRKFLEYIRMSL
jgi:hypothetical protein